MVTEGLSLRAIAAKIGGAVSHVTVRSIVSNGGTYLFGEAAR
jgi:hypothetical protein